MVFFIWKLTCWLYLGNSASLTQRRSLCVCKHVWVCKGVWKYGLVCMGVCVCKYGCVHNKTWVRLSCVWYVCNGCVDKQEIESINKSEWEMRDRCPWLEKELFAEKRDRQEVNIKTEQELRDKEWRLNTKTEIESQKC